MMFGGRERPFEVIDKALLAWRASDVKRADHLFQEGIAAYRRREPGGLDFALGRYGAFLLDQQRKEEALRVLEEAVRGGTDIPAIWSDYLRILGDRRDLQAFTAGVDAMAASQRPRVETDVLLSYARRAQRDGADEFAEGLARWILRRAERNGDRQGRWAAIGELGRILKASDHADDAVALWKKAFEEGSTDPVTADQLTMHLERDKQYALTMSLIRDALGRGLPASVEERLRKRMVRCEAKAHGRSQGTRRRAAGVPAYSVREGRSVLEQLFQIRLKPAVRDVDLVGATARCLLASKSTSVLVDVDLQTGDVVRRVEDLPKFGSVSFSPDGRGIGVQRSGAVGTGPTYLTFIDQSGSVIGQSSVPDATSDIALGPDLWYVGCRNGFLYGFGFDGRQRWAWETPGSQGYEGDKYLRPCPYYVASQRSFAAIASLGNVYAVGTDGRTLWRATLPNERETRWSFTVPIGDSESTRDAYGVLGLPPGASRSEAKTAYRQLALATHPDRNPLDPDAAAKFIEVQGAYERIVAGESESAVRGQGVTMTLEIMGLDPMSSFLAANAEGVVAGSSDGRIYLFDANGELRSARVLGEGAVRVALRPDGSVGAAWCDGGLVFLRGDRVINAAEAPWPNVLTMLGDRVVLGSKKEVHVMDEHGQLLWLAEFSKTVTNIAAVGDTLVCAAGVLTAFRTT